MVLADDHQIQQVLLNVINNARQAIEGHGSEGRIKIVTETSGSVVRIIIQDNGPGIPEENLSRIFDPFFTTKQVGKGTGLGLSLCYGIIKEHGGTITPLNGRGGGATFIIELPIFHLAGDTTEMLRASEAVGTDMSEGAGKKILVIDDEEIILEMLREELTSHGYEVDVAASGEAGLRRLKQNHCDVVFCDWKMPGLNGRQVYENIRTAQSRPLPARRFHHRRRRQRTDARISRAGKTLLPRQALHLRRSPRRHKNCPRRRVKNKTPRFTFFGVSV